MPKKCEYCDFHDDIEGRSLIEFDHENAELNIVKNGDGYCFEFWSAAIDTLSKNINYCPMCGRKLNNGGKY